MERVPKRLKTGDEPAVEAVKVKVKVESDNDDEEEEEEEEEESSDDDNNEEEEDKGREEQVAQPVAQVKRPGYIPSRLYVPPRPKNILMDYNVSMGDGVIPDKQQSDKTSELLVLHKIRPCVFGREQHRQMSDLRSVSGMLQQRTYRKALPNMYEPGRDIRMYVENTKKRQR
jgi:hypothetical protein